MIISLGRGYIFVHAPKTGGTSLALALEARAMRDDIMFGDTPKARKRRGRVDPARAAGRLWKHATLRDIDGLVNADDMNRMCVVTMVRNPWARVLSYYTWLRDQQFAHPAVGLARTLSFADFVAQPSVQASLRAAPATHYVTDARGKMCGTLFVRLEHLAQDLAPFEAHLGFSLEVPHVNASGAPDIAQAYDPVTRGIVAEVCAADIARFGYRFGG